MRIFLLRLIRNNLMATLNLTEMEASRIRPKSITKTTGFLNAVKNIQNVHNNIYNSTNIYDLSRAHHISTSRIYSAINVGLFQRKLSEKGLELLIPLKDNYTDNDSVKCILYEYHKPRALREKRKNKLPPSQPELSLDMKADPEDLLNTPASTIGMLREIGYEINCEISEKPKMRKL